MKKPWRVKVIGHDGVNWSIDADRRHLDRFLEKMPQVELVEFLWKAEAVFFVWYHQLNTRYLPLWKLWRNLLGKKILAVATNDLRHFPDRFKALRGVVDVWVASSGHNADFLKQHGCRYVQLPYYVSPQRFQPRKASKEQLLKDLGVDPVPYVNKILIGSFQRDSEGANLHQPKWYKNPELLVEICERLPKDRFALVLAGPRRHYLVQSCRRLGIPYLYIGDEAPIDRHEDDVMHNNLSKDTIAQLYQLVDLYIVTSRSEGGPKAILEATLTETPIFSTDVGLAADFLGQEWLYAPEQIDQLVEQIEAFDPSSERVQRSLRAHAKTTHGVLNDQAYMDRLGQLFDQLA